MTENNIVSLSDARTRRSGTFPICVVESTKPSNMAREPSQTVNIYATVAAERKIAWRLRTVLAARFIPGLEPGDNDRMVLVLHLCDTVPDNWLIGLRVGIIDKSTGYLATCRVKRILEKCGKNRVSVLTSSLMIKPNSAGEISEHAGLIWRTPGGTYKGAASLQRLLTARNEAPQPTRNLRLVKTEYDA